MTVQEGTSRYIQDGTAPVWGMSVAGVVASRGGGGRVRMTVHSVYDLRLVTAALLNSCPSCTVIITFSFCS